MDHNYRRAMQFHNCHKGGLEGSDMKSITSPHNPIVYNTKYVLSVPLT
jgi:hypothetical protein